MQSILFYNSDKFTDNIDPMDVGQDMFGEIGDWHLNWSFGFEMVSLEVNTDSKHKAHIKLLVNFNFTVFYCES